MKQDTAAADAIPGKLITKRFVARRSGPVARRSDVCSPALRNL